MMQLYYCPSCGNQDVRQLENPTVMYCSCGMVWRALSSDIHRIVSDDKKGAIREILDSTLVFYHRKKDEEWNRIKEERKQRAIDYLVGEIFKGPMEGGTMAEPSSVCGDYSSELWVALQRAILIRDETCMICGRNPSEEVHHIRPRHLKGKNHPRNLIGLCRICHDDVHRRIDEGIQSVLENSLEINPKWKLTTDITSFTTEGASE